MPRSSSAVQRKIRQRRPFRSLGHEAVVALLKISDLLHRGFAEVVEPEGLTLQQYNVLRILRGAGPGGLPTLEIAERMIERAPGITRLIDRLGAKRLVARQRLDEDRRTVICRITPAGLRVLGRLDGPMDAADEAALSGLPKPEQRELVRVLNRLLEGLD